MLFSFHSSTVNSTNVFSNCRSAPLCCNSESLSTFAFLNLYAAAFQWKQLLHTCLPLLQNNFIPIVFLTKHFFLFRLNCLLPWSNFPTLAPCFKPTPLLLTPLHKLAAFFPVKTVCAFLPWSVHLPYCWLPFHLFIVIFSSDSGANSSVFLL